MKLVRFKSTFKLSVYLISGLILVFCLFGFIGKSSANKWSISQSQFTYVKYAGDSVFVPLGNSDIPIPGQERKVADKKMLYTNSSRSGVAGCPFAEEDSETKVSSSSKWLDADFLIKTTIITAMALFLYLKLPPNQI
jgi:hypothetical protein